MAGDIGLLEEERRHSTPHFGVRNTDAHDDRAACPIETRTGDEATLEACKGRRHLGVDGRACRRPTIGGKTGRNVERDDAPAARVDGIDHPRGHSARRSTRARAEQRVHHEVGVAERLGQMMLVLDDDGTKTCPS